MGWGQYRLQSVDLYRAMTAGKRDEENDILLLPDKGEAEAERNYFFCITFVSREKRYASSTLASTHQHPHYPHTPRLALAIAGRASCSSPSPTLPPTMPSFTTAALLKFILLLITMPLLTFSNKAELDALYLDPKPYLSVRASPNTPTTRRVVISPSRHLEWYQQRDAARQHVNNGDLDLAKQQFQSIILTKSVMLPARVVAGLHLELGDVYLLMGDEDQCRHHYLEAQAFVPQAYLPHVRLAKLSIQLGHFNTAIDHFKHALFFNHSHLVSLHDIGALLFIQCKVDEAWYYFDVAIHGTDHPEQYQRVSLVPTNAEEEDSEPGGSEEEDSSEEDSNEEGAHEQATENESQVGGGERTQHQLAAAAATGINGKNKDN